MQTNEILAWSILVVGFFMAAIGTIIPGLPGAAFVLMAVLFHKWLLPEVFTWITVGVIAGLTTLSWIVDLMSGYWGAKLGGATKKGLWGAAIGGFIGISFGLPGLLLGPFFGAIVGDLIDHRRDLAVLFKSGAGAAMGFVFSLGVRFIVLGVMAVVVLFAVIM